MDEGDFAAVFRDVVALMHEHGFDDLNDRILRQLDHVEGPASAHVMGYLALLRAEWALGSRDTADLIVERMNVAVQTEDRRSVAAIHVVPTGLHREIYGREAVDLREAPSLEDVIYPLDRLMEDLLEDRRGPEWQ